MAKVTIGFGILLAMVGVAGFFATGAVHPTALIPCGFGLLLCLAGILASAQPGKRMLWMHIAVTLGLLGFLGTIPAVVDVMRLAHGVAMAHPVAVEEKAAMSLLCLLYVSFCVRSFVLARRDRRETTA